MVDRHPREKLNDPLLLLALRREVATSVSLSVARPSIFLSTQHYSAILDDYVRAANNYTKFSHVRLR